MKHFLAFSWYDYPGYVPEPVQPSDDYSLTFIALVVVMTVIICTQSSAAYTRKYFSDKK
jgi:hypothetical protein